MHFGRPRAKTEPTSPAERGRFNSELPNTKRHHLGKQVQSVGPSSHITALVRFRLHTWPTVSTYLCPSKVQAACLAYCLHPPLPGSGQESRRMRPRSPFLCLAVGEAFQSIWQGYSLSGRSADQTAHLPGGYLLGAYTDGAYLLGGGFIRAQLSLPPRR